MCVVTGANAQGDCFLDVVGSGPPTEAELVSALAGRVAEGAIVATDDRAAYDGALAEVGAAAHRVVSSKDRSTGVINLVNSLHSRLESFLGGFGGVSARRLHHYLMWFKWQELAKRVGERGERIALASSQAAGGVYSTTWREYWKQPYPEFG